MCNYYTGAPWVIKFGKLSIRDTVRHRTSVWTFRVGISRNEFLPSPLESFVPLFQKALEIIENQNLSTDQMFG